VQRRVGPLGGELLPHAGDGHAADAQGLGHALVWPGVGAVGIGLEQDLGAGPGVGFVGVGADQSLERLPLLVGQPNHYLMRRGHRASS
jgi:hypothetical protein